MFSRRSEDHATRHPVREEPLFEIRVHWGGLIELRFEVTCMSCTIFLQLDPKQAELWCGVTLHAN